MKKNKIGRKDNMALCGTIALNQSASDLGTPTTGLMYWNTTNSIVRIYSGSNWNDWPEDGGFDGGGSVKATGGDVVCCNGGGYVCHFFYSSGSLTLSAPNTSLDDIYIFMTSGGGGGGGNAHGGGGGAGTLTCLDGIPCCWRGPYCFTKVPNTTQPNNPVVETLPVTVGGGGFGGSQNPGISGHGSASCVRIFFKAGSPNQAPFHCCIGGGTVCGRGCTWDVARAQGYGNINTIVEGSYGVICATCLGGGLFGNPLTSTYNGGASESNAPTLSPNGGSGGAGTAQDREGGGGGNYGSDDDSANCGRLNAESPYTSSGPNPTTYFNNGGVGACGWKHPDFPFVCIGGGGSGGSHKGNSTAYTTDPAEHDLQRLCSGSQGYAGKAWFPVASCADRSGSNAATISSPFASGFVGGGGGAGGYNGNGGQGSSGIVVIKYKCV